MQGPEGLRRHLAKDQQHKGQKRGAERHQKLAAHSQRDEAHQNRRRHIDHGAEKQDQSDQTIGTLPAALRPDARRGCPRWPGAAGDSGSGSSGRFHCRRKMRRGSASPASVANKNPRDGCSIRRKSTPVPPEQILEDEFHAEIRDRQNPETAQGPAHRGSAAPAKAQAPDEQHAEDAATRSATALSFAPSSA